MGEEQDRGMNRPLIRLSFVVAALVLALAAVATGGPNRKIWCAGNICVADDGGITPKQAAPASDRRRSPLASMPKSAPATAVTRRPSNRWT